MLQDGLKGRGLRSAEPLLVRYGRVKVAEQIAETLQAPLRVERTHRTINVSPPGPGCAGVSAASSPPPVGGAVRLALRRPNGTDGGSTMRLPATSAASGSQAWRQISAVAPTGAGKPATAAVVPTSRATREMMAAIDGYSTVIVVSNLAGRAGTAVQVSP